MNEGQQVGQVTLARGRKREPATCETGPVTCAKRGDHNADWDYEGGHAEHVIAPGNCNRVRGQDFSGRHDGEIGDVHEDIAQGHNGNAIDDCQRQIPDIFFLINKFEFR